MKRRPYWLMILVMIGAAVWGFNRTCSRINTGEVAAYVRANTLDVIELKDGRKAIGKIVGETPENYFLKNMKGAEEKIGRNTVKIKRGASAEELEIARVLLARYNGRSAAQRTTVWEKARSMIDSVAGKIEAEAKYNSEVAAARQAKHNLERRLAEEKAKEKGAEEGLSLEDRILKWIQSGGIFAKKEE